MDIQSQTTQPISDDQELAKVLAGVNADIDADSNNQDTNTTPGTPPIERLTPWHTLAFEKR